ncbi:hypothetical protein AB1Y20_003898 [Prymnesium parvum]|uniref:Uncharacterized protein n=1 Tax=Prymnesium parvum TaxID=97485 RepID=A0AB34J612_PRYPA
MMHAASRAAADAQRKAFFTLLRVQDFLIPVDAAVAKASLDPFGRPKGAAAEEARRVKEDAAREADALVARHAAALPAGCVRAAAHLQMAALAVGAQRTLLQAAAREEYGWGGGETLRARSVVAGALGVVAPPDGSAPYGAAVMWLPNRTAVALSWDKKATVARMVENFKADLGEAFELQPVDPAPSVRMTRCLYTEILRAEGEPMLAPIFWALHEATFKGVPAYSFEPSQEQGDTATVGTFWFK